MLYHCNMFLFLFCSNVHVQLVLGWKVIYGVEFMYSQLALSQSWSQWYQVTVLRVSQHSSGSSIHSLPSSLPPSLCSPKERNLRKLNFTPCLILVNSLYIWRTYYNLYFGLNRNSEFEDNFNICVKQWIMLCIQSDSLLYWFLVIFAPWVRPVILKVQSANQQHRHHT